MTLPKPYYNYNGITIYHGDCRDILPDLPKVDLVLTDPPYGVGFQYNGADDSRKNYEKLIADVSPWISRQRCAAVTPGIVNICYWPQPRWVMAWIKNNSMGASKLSGPNRVSRNLWEPVLWYGEYPPHQVSRDLLYAPKADTMMRL